MKTAFAAKLLAVASACLLLPAPARPENLLLNPGFEESNLGRLQGPPNPADPWHPMGGIYITNSPTHSGSRAARLHAVPGSAAGFVHQAVPGVVLGQDYVIEFWASSAGPGSLGAAFGMNVPLAWQVTLSSATEYTHYSFKRTAIGPPEVFIMWSLPLGVTAQSVLYVDDVSVTVVPEPSALSLLPLASGAALVRLLRKRRLA